MQMEHLVHHTKYCLENTNMMYQIIMIDHLVEQESTVTGLRLITCMRATAVRAGGFAVLTVLALFSGNLYDSNGYEGSNSSGVRPVVSLKSDVQLKWNDTANEWQIQ